MPWPLTGRSREMVAIAINPALDRVALAPNASSGGTVRASEYLETPGGKAVHAGLVAATLDTSATIIAALGDGRGRRVSEMLGEQPVNLVTVRIEGETRGTYTLVDPLTPYSGPSGWGSQGASRPPGTSFSTRRGRSSGGSEPTTSSAPCNSPSRVLAPMRP